MKIDKEILDALILIGNIGFTVVINMLLCVYLYKIYEKHFGFSSIVFILLMILGVYLSFYNIINIIKKK